MAVKSKKQKIELLTRISGISDKHAEQAVNILGIESLGAFITAGKNGELQKISGVGAKTEARMLAAALSYQEENLDQKSTIETQKKKQNLEPKQKQVDSTVSSTAFQPLPELEKLTLPKLAMRLLQKVILKAIKNR